ncbi:molybdopterin oxidoreductase [Kineococcus indalonis]|uniref:molybdopterin oxidoreductase n=1 Tax=Kineococcus indalonis TaxID=2696566 RepID=UPI0014125167|nr:molybdopterin oxidoreductase [Kineococcus indalonis]NAZ86208.1 molybdopterin oxidoreductase [Kineococcus indalonis]
MSSTPRFLQGAFPFTGAGLEKPAPVEGLPAYAVPDGVRAQPVYLRAGNSSDELISVVLLRDGVAMRWFPVGARSSVHVALRIVEDVEAPAALELRVAAPEGVSGTVVLDLGLVEV